MSNLKTISAPPSSGGGAGGGAGAGAASVSAGSNLKSAPMFDQMAAAVAKDGASLVKQVKGVIQFIVTPGGEWVVDLKNGTGSVRQGRADKADMTLTVADDDFAAIAAGKLNPQQVGGRNERSRVAVLPLAGAAVNLKCMWVLLVFAAGFHAWQAQGEGQHGTSK